MNALMKLLEPMIEQFKPQMEAWGSALKEGVETMKRIEGKLDAIITTHEEHAAQIAHQALQIEELMTDKSERSKYNG